MALMKLEIIAQKEHEGKRIDAVLAEWLPTQIGQEVSKGKVRKLIMAGAVYLNGRRIRIASKALIPGAKLEAYVDIEKLKQDRTVADQPFTFDPSLILFEDKWLIAVHKPPGLPTQPTLDEARDNLYASLKRFLSERENDPNAYVGLHHRLDRDTSGVVLFTKNKDANPGTATLFAEHQIRKTYHALAQRPGIRPGNMAPEWKVKNFLRRAEGKRAKFRSVHAGGDHAETDFSLLGDYQRGIWVECRPVTGRTHQIRVHLSEGGMSILGDDLYGTQNTREDGSAASLAKRLMLHAKELRFPHPVTLDDVKIESPLPSDFQECLRWLKNGESQPAAPSPATAPSAPPA
jgi:RluA family pseudouridine synthase